MLCHGHTPPGAFLRSTCFSPTAQGDGSPLPQSASGNAASRPSWPEYRSAGFGSDTFIHVWSVWATGSHGWAGGPAPETWSPDLEAESLRGRCRRGLFVAEGRSPGSFGRPDPIG